LILGTDSLPNGSVRALENEDDEHEYEGLVRLTRENRAFCEAGSLLRVRGLLNSRFASVQEPIFKMKESIHTVENSFLKSSGIGPAFAVRIPLPEPESIIYSRIQKLPN